MVPGFPENTTAVVGGQAKLVCKVHRPLSTRVQWLKREASQSGQTREAPPRPRELTVRTSESSQFSFSPSHVQIKGSNQSSRVQPLQSNASKVYVLNLHNVTMEDAGEYVCMAESPTGQSLQSAWLEVLPGRKLSVITHVRLDPPVGRLNGEL